MFVWLVFLGAIGALKDNNHLGVDLLVKILPANLKKGAYILSNLIMLYTLWLVLNGSLKMTNHTINSIAPATGLPYAIMNGSGIIMSICMAIILLHNIYQALVEPNAIERLTQMKDSEEMIVEPKPMATQEGVSS
jgi:TRAP-type C4-dicarboxylate transport system permease small subunit